MTTNHDKKNKFISGAFWGAIAGAALGVLFAPKSGKETRKLIKDKAKDAVDKGREMAEKGEEIARDAYGNVKERVEDIRDEFGGKKEDK